MYDDKYKYAEEINYGADYYKNPHIKSLPYQLIILKYSKG